MKVLTRYDRAPISRSAAPARKGLGVSIRLDAQDPDSGFLRLTGRIMRTGCLEYGDGKSTWLEYRSKDEIERALPSFKLAVLTNDHPDGLVNVDNVRELDIGHGGSAFRWVMGDDGEEYVETDFLITDAEAIRMINEQEKAELSVGFRAEIHNEPGVHNGLKYDFTQRALAGNHIAVVEEGRAGPVARLVTDAEVTVEEVEVELGGEMFKLPKAVADLIANLQLMLKQKTEEGEAAQAPAAPAAPMAPAAPAPAEAPRADTSKLEAERDSALAQLEAMKKDSRKLVADRLDLERRALSAGLPSRTFSAQSDNELRCAVIKAVQPELASKVDARSDDDAYLTAVYDSVVTILDSRQDDGGLTDVILDTFRSAGPSASASEYIAAIREGRA